VLDVLVSAVVSFRSEEEGNAAIVSSSFKRVGFLLWFGLNVVTAYGAAASV
jgi:hypothetical protein